MAGSLSLVAVVVLLFAGVAQATAPTCAAGYKDCDKVHGNGCEVNTGTDVNNCGDCGHKCGSFCGINAVPVCKAAKCEFTCKAPFLNCDSNWKNGCELDGSKDVNNCGACGNKCPVALNSSPFCNGSKCGFTCKPTFADCDKKPENGCETCTAVDTNNCGACGVKCAEKPNAVTKCDGGKCEYTCKPGFSNCDGDWTNGCEAACGSDVNNCGACGMKCKVVPNSFPKCVGGKCDFTCKPTFSDCDKKPENGCETCTAVDTSNCGACGVKCAEKPNAVTKCAGGKCEYTCKLGFNNCDGDWTNGCEAACGSDVKNCGACGAKCKDMPNAITKCAGGKCVYTCKPGYSNCDGDWTNGCEALCGNDVNNCGACGVKCQDKPNAVTKCFGGKCTYTCKPGFSNCDGDWTNGCEAACGSDVNNCGACGTKCKDVPNAVTKCYNGKCDYYCKPGFSNCDGNWVNGCEGMCSSDVNNCGACGVKCKIVSNAVTNCASGKCVYSCKPAFANCDGDWTNGCECMPATDSNNCGACGKKCHVPTYAGGEAKCTNGKCETQSCKKGMKWDTRQRCCVNGGKE